MFNNPEAILPEYYSYDLSRITLQWANIKKWGRDSGGQFHTNHCILSTRTSSCCLCLQECEKDLLVAILDSNESSSVPVISALGYRKSSVKPPLSNIPAISCKPSFSGKEKLIRPLSPPLYYSSLVYDILYKSVTTIKLHLDWSRIVYSRVERSDLFLFLCCLYWAFHFAF